METVTSSKRPVLDCSKTGQAGVSKTKQSEARNCDLNLAIKRYKKNQQLTGPLLHQKILQFADLQQQPEDLLQAMTIIKNADNSFLELPPEIREEFKNSPLKMLEFLNNPENNEKAIELGLKQKPEEVNPIDVNIINPPVEEPTGD